MGKLLNGFLLELKWTCTYLFYKSSWIKRPLINSAPSEGAVLVGLGCFMLVSEWENNPKFLIPEKQELNLKMILHKFENVLIIIFFKL